MHTPLPAPWWHRIAVALAAAVTAPAGVVMLGGIHHEAGWIMLFGTAILVVPLLFRSASRFRTACWIAAVIVLVAALAPTILSLMLFRHILPALVLVGVAAADRSRWSWIPLAFFLSALAVFQVPFAVSALI